MPDIYALVHAIESSVFESGAPPAGTIISQFMSVTGASQGGRWLAPAPRITRQALVGHYRGFVTHAANVFVWPDTPENQGRIPALKERLRASVATALSAHDSDWVVGIEPYAPALNGTDAFWACNVAGNSCAATTHTRDTFPTVAGRLDADENPTGPTGPETHPTSVTGGIAAYNSLDLGGFKTFGYIMLGLGALYYVGPVIREMVAGKRTKREAIARLNPMGKLRAGKIVLDRQEGLHREVGKVTIVGGDVFDKARQQLRVWARTAPREGSGYHKIRFHIYWADGDSYDGRFDLQKFGSVDLAKQVRETLPLLSSKEEAQAFLAKHAVGREST